jgi:hypothetical protein
MTRLLRLHNIVEGTFLFFLFFFESLLLPSASEDCFKAGGLITP